MATCAAAGARGGNALHMRSICEDDGTALGSSPRRARSRTRVLCVISAMAAAAAFAAAVAFASACCAIASASCSISSSICLHASTSWSFLLSIILSVSLLALICATSSLMYASPSLFLSFGRNSTIFSTPATKSPSSKTDAASSTTRVASAFVGTASDSAEFGATLRRRKPCNLPLKLASFAALLGALMSFTPVSISACLVGVRANPSEALACSSPPIARLAFGARAVMEKHAREGAFSP
mmetsp:Transcript_9068/g.38122  ORF Transcript_9068/g.38122 Transcript_9068/m.38122 type:complete len:240 (-) Transcript_9068:132-851(-)